MNAHPPLDTAMSDLNPAQRTFRRARINAFASRGLDVSELCVSRPDGGRTYVLIAGEARSRRYSSTQVLETQRIGRRWPRFSAAAWS